METIYAAGLSGDEGFARLRLIERNTAFSSRQAMIVMTMPISLRSIFRASDLSGIAFVEVSFFMGSLSVKDSPSATRCLPHPVQLSLPVTGQNKLQRYHP